MAEISQPKDAPAPPTTLTPEEMRRDAARALPAHEAATLAAQGKARCPGCRQIKKFEELLTVVYLSRTLLLGTCPECMPPEGIVIHLVNTPKGKQIRVAPMEPRRGPGLVRLASAVPQGLSDLKRHLMPQTRKIFGDR